MGIMIQGKCPGCGYHAEISIGGGLRDCLPETALSAAREDPGLEAALKENARFRIERFPAVCKTCRQLLAAQQVTYWTSDKTEHVVPAACPVCGGPVKQSGADIPCPLCGCPLNRIPMGHWD